MVLTVAAVVAVLVYGYRRFHPQRAEHREWPLTVGFVAVALLETTDLLSLALPRTDRFWERFSICVSSASPCIWLLTSITYARSTSFKTSGLVQRGLLFLALLVWVAGLVAPLDLLLYAPDFPAEQVMFLRTPGFWLYLLITVFLLLALMNLELTLSHASTGELWKLKFEAMGVGILIAAYMLYFSQGVLFRTLDLRFLIVRALFVLFAIGLMLFAQTRQDRAVRIRVSRQVAYKSVVLFVVGLYLIFVGLMGEGLKHLGVPFYKVFVIFLAIATAVSLILVLLSGRVRREVVVFLNKHFFDAKYDYRTHWLEFTHRLASPQGSSALQHVILNAYCETFGIQGAALFLFDPEIGAYITTCLYEMDPIPEQFTPDRPLVRYLSERNWVFNIQDDNPEIIAAHGGFLRRCHVSFVIPLRADTTLEGFIALCRPIKEHEQYIYEDFDLMKTFARQATVSILNQRLAEQVSRLREMEAIGNISTFVIHDLKNHVAALSLLVENARQFLDNPEFQQDMLRSLDNTVAKMQGLIGKLKNLGDKELLNLQSVDLQEVARQAVATVHGVPVILNGETVVVRADADELQKILLNLLINAVEASPDQMPITVEVGSLPQPFFRVADQGSGMSLDFQRRELFKPFATTKKKGLGIGLYQCRRIVEAHGGRIEVQSEVGSGSVFTVWLPAAELLSENYQP